jgi:hypothetical protein
MFTLNTALLDEARAVFAARPQLYWIVGGSCAGKSTVAQALGDRLGMETLDMDTLIYDKFMGRYAATRHPASTAWFTAPNPLAWVMGLSWEEFDALTAAADAEYLDLFAAELASRDAMRPLLVDGGVAHPAVLAQVFSPARMVCIAVDDGVRASCWEQADERAEMRSWIGALPDAEAMWAKFLGHDRLMAQTMDAECAAAGIARVLSAEDEPVAVTAVRVATVLGLE